MTKIIECICYECNKTYKQTSIEPDCACEGAPDVYIQERCNTCDVKDFCDIFKNPELYK